MGASWFAPQALAASIEVDLVVTPQVGSFRYEASVRNNSAVDLTLVSIVNAPVADPLIAPSLNAPPGFLAFYDPGSALLPGFINFLENTSVFGTGMTIGGFRFISSSLAGGNILTMFEAINVNGDEFSGTIRIMTTPGGAVPDAGSSLILAVFALVFIAVGRRLKSFTV